jgi:hypothetical protein
MRAIGTRRHESAVRAAVSYVAAAGSVSFVINLFVNVSWRELVRLASTPNGQAIGVVFGGLIVLVMAASKRFVRR